MSLRHSSPIESFPPPRSTRKSPRTSPWLWGRSAGVQDGDGRGKVGEGAEAQRPCQSRAACSPDTGATPGPVRAAPRPRGRSRPPSCCSSGRSRSCTGRARGGREADGLSPKKGPEGTGPNERGPVSSRAGPAAPWRVRTESGRTGLGLFRRGNRGRKSGEGGEGQGDVPGLGGRTHGEQRGVVRTARDLASVVKARELSCRCQ